MTYLDNTFSNSSAVQAHIYFFLNQISYHLDLLYVAYSSIFQKFYPVEKVKKS